MLDSVINEPYAIDSRLMQSSAFIAAIGELEEAAFPFNVVQVKNLGCAGYYDSKNKAVQVDKVRPAVIKDGSVIHETRHAYHDMKGVLRDNKGESRRSNLLLMEADAVAFELTVAFEVKDIYPELWTSYVGYNPTYLEMCRVFEETYAQDKSNLQNGLCAHNVFIAYLNDDDYRRKYFKGEFPRLNSDKKTSSLPRSEKSLRKYFSAGVSLGCVDKHTGAVQPRQTYLSSSHRDEIFHALTV